jgi:hypothetical protein
VAVTEAGRTQRRRGLTYRSLDSEVVLSRLQYEHAILDADVLLAVGIDLQLVVPATERIDLDFPFPIVQRGTCKLVLPHQLPRRAGFRGRKLRSEPS